MLVYEELLYPWSFCCKTDRKCRPRRVQDKDQRVFSLSDRSELPTECVGKADPWTETKSGYIRRRLFLTCVSFSERVRFRQLRGVYTKTLQEMYRRSQKRWKVRIHQRGVGALACSLGQGEQGINSQHPGVVLGGGILSGRIPGSLWLNPPAPEPPPTASRNACGQAPLLLLHPVEIWVSGTWLLYVPNLTDYKGC